MCPWLKVTKLENGKQDCEPRVPNSQSSKSQLLLLSGFLSDLRGAPEVDLPSHFLILFSSV